MFKKIVISIILLCCMAMGFAGCEEEDWGDTCSVCGGSGIVDSRILGSGSGIQYGFDTYYRCAGCHGTGKS